MSAVIIDISARPGPSYAVMSDQTGGTNGGTLRYSVPQAARYLGISERAVRKRITAGSLAADRDGRQWVVFLPAVLGAVSGGTSSDDGAVPSEPIEAQYRITPSEIEQAIERTGDKYVTDMQAMLAPLVKQITEQAETIGRVTAERDALQRRIDALEARQRSAQETAVLRTIQTHHTPQTSTRRVWWRLWKR